MVENGMITADQKRNVSKRLQDARLRLLFNNPFYGNLLLHLKFVLAQCGTAATDMKRIIWDPEFVMRLSDDELDFILKHEILHCVFQHCIRGKNKNKELFNIACDIVVNSNIMHSMNRYSLRIDGEKVMHLTPNKKEGFLYSAEEVYDMLISKYGADRRESGEAGRGTKNDCGSTVDNHEVWTAVPHHDSLSDEWNIYIEEAAKAAGEECPPCVRKIIEDLEHESKLDWRKVLNDFIREVNDRYDFSFSPTDRRFSDSDFLMPSFVEMQGEMVDNIWFLIDTSGSVSTEELSVALKEIGTAIGQFDKLVGKLSFFDTRVSEPVDLDGVESLKEIKAVGGGGTSFRCIFEYMKENMEEKLPTAIIVLTDGYSEYPEIDLAMDVPVLWIISGENQNDAPWGVTIHV